MGNLTQATYATVRKVAFRETANFKEQGEIRAVRYVGNPRGALSIRVLFWALSGASRKTWMSRVRRSFCNRQLPRKILVARQQYSVEEID